WKCSSTSWSIRSVTCSLIPGTAFVFGGASATLAVTFLNAASASVRASFRVRGRRGWSAISDSFKQHGGEIALRERRHDGQNGLAGVFGPLAALDRGRNRRPRRDAAGNALMPRQCARGVDRGRAVDLDDLVDHGAVEDIRDEARADALDLVRRMLAARQH